MVKRLNLKKYLKLVYLKDESEEEKEKRENIRQKEMKFVEGICSTERLLDEDKIL